MGRGVHQQRGASLILIMLIVALIIFFGTLAFNMLPAYLDFMQVRSSMAAVKSKEDVVAGGPRSIMNAIMAQLDINSVRSVPSDSFKFERTREGLVLTANYDVQKPIIMNVDVVMHFVHSETYNP